MAAPHVAGAAALYLQVGARRRRRPGALGDHQQRDGRRGHEPGLGHAEPPALHRLLTAGGGGNQAPTASFTRAARAWRALHRHVAPTATGPSRRARGTSATAARRRRPTRRARTRRRGTYTVTLTVTDNGGAQHTTHASGHGHGGGGGDPDPSTPTLTNGVCGIVHERRRRWLALLQDPGAGRPAEPRRHARRRGLRPDRLQPGPRPLRPSRGEADDRGATTARRRPARRTRACSVASPAADWWYIGVYTYSGSSVKAFTIRASY